MRIMHVLILREYGALYFRENIPLPSDIKSIANALITDIPKPVNKSTNMDTPEQIKAVKSAFLNLFNLNIAIKHGNIIINMFKCSPDMATI